VQERTLDCETGPKLRSNLIGRFLGRDEFRLEGDSVVTLKRGRRVVSVSIGASRKFATFSKDFLGGELTLNLEDGSVRFRFLRAAGAEEFLRVLNETIAAHLERYVDDVFTAFQIRVVHEYPRDSRVEQLVPLFQTLSTAYGAQAHLWDRYLSSGHIQKVKDLIRFHPVTATALREHHERIQLHTREAFFDRVESNPLTLEQRLGVLRSNDRNLVLAAAGTGKTSVMVAKTLDLIDRGLARPEEILVLAYNRAAAEELRIRLAKAATKSDIPLDSAPQISTFHALGRQLLREAKVSTYMSVFTEDEVKLKQWVTSWLEGYLASDSRKLLKFISLFPQPVNQFDFATLADYERYVRDNEFRTLNGERVRGYQELLIANAIYLNGVQYEYEEPYVTKRRLDIGYDYRPDFHIKGTNIYVEHFGIDRRGGTAPGIDSLKYNESMRSKRALHVECGTVLVETFHYEWVEGNLIDALYERLAKQGVVFKPLLPGEVLAKLRAESRISEWSDLLKKALQAIRVERLDEDAMHVRLEKADVAQAKTVAEVLDALHRAYVEELHRQNAIDFDDMIIRAIQVVDSRAYVPPWKFVLVDEFQDISEARMEFIKAIVAKGPDPSLTVVGDDWQSIYRFSGGKLELTTRFGELVGEFTATKLQKTFRYNNSIAEIAGCFVMENPEQYKKQIETHTKVDRSQVHLLDDSTGEQAGVYDRVVEVIRKIRQNDTAGSIAVIARYNYLLVASRVALANDGLHANVDFWTFHKSKGLEADYCVLIGFFQGKSGFPNENKDKAIIEALMPSLDSYPYSEERRLLYVGLTRARSKVYVIANPNAPSSFVTELLAPKYDLNIVSKKFQETYRKTFKCPSCADGYFRLIDGQYGGFYSCSSGLGCAVGKARVCTKCRAPSIDGRSASVCNNVPCVNTIKICEKCGRPMKLRESKFGLFWGCTGYGIKDDQCRHTAKHDKSCTVEYAQ
jgi:DNA helicase-4